MIEGAHGKHIYEAHPVSAFMSILQYRWWIVMTSREPKPLNATPHPHAALYSRRKAILIRAMLKETSNLHRAEHGYSTI